MSNGLLRLVTVNKLHKTVKKTKKGMHTYRNRRKFRCGLIFVDFRRPKISMRTVQRIVLAVLGRNVFVHSVWIFIMPSEHSQCYCMLLNFA